MTGFLRRLALVAVAVAVIPAAALASQTYPDEPGDAPSGAPDVTQIKVSHTRAGAMTFRLHFSNRTTLVGDDTVLILLDSHQGAPDGQLEYGLLLLGDTPLAAVVDLEAEKVLAAVPVEVSDGVAVTVSKTLIGNPGGLVLFAVMSSSGDMTEATTEAVPHDGYLMYSTAVAVAKVTFATATAPKAGAVFRLAPVKVALTTDETVKPDKVIAVARINGRVLKSLPGGVSWKIPKAARGQKLVVSVTAIYGGSSKTQVVRYTIR